MFTEHLLCEAEGQVRAGSPTGSLPLPTRLVQEAQERAPPVALGPQVEAVPARQQPAGALRPAVRVPAVQRAAVGCFQKQRGCLRSDEHTVPFRKRFAGGR